jgi:N-acetylmuramoyl-L-alanine amidase
MTQYRNGNRATSPIYLCLLCLILFLPGPASGQSAGSSNGIPVSEASISGIVYFSLQSLSDGLGGSTRYHPLKKKTELRVAGHSLVFTLLSSVVVLDDVAYRLPVEVILHENTFHVPKDPVLTLIRRIRPGLAFGSTPQAKSVTAGTPPAPPPEPIRQPEIDADRWILDTVIIDPGHGGKDPGAIGPGGTREKEIVLQVGKRLKALLEKQLKVKAVLTREDDTFIPLGQRARIARQNSGKIFVSLHCNASKKRKSRGVEVYFLSEAKTEEAAEVAKRENAVIRFEENGETAEASNPIADIQLGLLSTQWLKESQDVAAGVRNAITQTLTHMEDRGVRQANFYVMRGTMGDMPSILVEMGFISNSNEEKLLKSRSFQNNMAESIYRGIKQYKKSYERQLTKHK